MTPEMKFRAWDTDRNEMLIPEELGEIRIGAAFYSTKQNFIWMQFTGLHDKNGKGIYEGDVARYGTGRRGVNAKKHPGIVVWQEDGAYFRIKHLDSDSGISWNVYGAELWCEVIGNIYDNPNLIGEEQKY